MGGVKAVLLDAFGTLVTLDAPAPLLRALLAERLGVSVTETQAGAALGAEIGYYRSHMQEGTDAERVGELQTRCAQVLREALPRSSELDRSDPATVTSILLDALRFRVYPEVPDALGRLRAAGTRLVVASNWDASLEGVLQRVGLLELVDGAVNSATVGAAKPDPRVIEAALRLADVAPSAALHVGDSFREDVGAALGGGRQAGAARARRPRCRGRAAGRGRSDPAGACDDPVAGWVARVARPLIAPRK